jgi:hypothetical protein
MTDKELILEIEAQKALMIAVATGGPKIQLVNSEYGLRRARIKEGLNERGLDDPNLHGDLWSWYGKWSSGDLPTWASRRIYISEMYGPLLDHLQSITPSSRPAEPTGWNRVDRGIQEIRERLEVASTEEQFQAIGLLSRETLISLAQEVYVPDIHKSLDAVQPSETDAKRMLEAYINHELAGGANEAARRHVRAALTLANDLQHRRTATFRDAALCAEATTSVVNSIAILSGRVKQID